MAAGGEDKNLYAFPMTYFLLDSSSIIINISCASFRNFPLVALTICGCVKLMSLSRVLATLPHVHPPPFHQPWAMLEILSGEGGVRGGRKQGSERQGHLRHVNVSLTDEGQRDPCECRG